MIRLIFERTIHSEATAYHYAGKFTRDIDMPEIETLLTAGGCGPDGYDHTTLIGVEILTTPAQKKG